MIWNDGSSLLSGLWLLHIVSAKIQKYSLFINVLILLEEKNNQ